MNSKIVLRQQLQVRQDFLLRLVVFTIGAHGLFVILITLLDQLAARQTLATGSDFDIPLLIGLGLVYLSTLLRRRKQMAWGVAILVYSFMIGLYAHRSTLAFQHHNWLEVITKLLIPIGLIGLLACYHRTFTVRSDIRSFRYSIRVIALILLVALAYGTVGFMLLDRHDFHQEITLSAALDRTVDQFGLSSSQTLVPHTHRAKLFVNSLSIVSVGSLVYVALSLFQPIRARVSGGHHQREQAKEILDKYPGKSEDFFKLWPEDKSYLFNPTGNCGLAYKTERGVALVAGDPFGERKSAKKLLRQFEDLCYGNDWLPVFVHTEPDWTAYYERHGYSVQKIGEEAVLELDHFADKVQGGKYFRQISNKFAREKYVSEVLQPPHDNALISRLQTISQEWLDRPGRAERGFMMGYFSEAYLQQCSLIIARDSAGTIQGFINQIPSYDPDEANFDMLRHANGALGNINDYLLMAYITYSREQSIKRLNLGLCPLAGMDDLEEKSIISRGLHLLYANGDRFYSFSGLHRFKSKYEPTWSDRYVVYRGNPTNFVRAMNALNRAMRVKQK